MEQIRVWRGGAFELKLWDTHKLDWRGQSVLAYKLRHRGRLIFKGRDYSGSPLHCDDSDETVAGLLAFLSLKPGDTDREYFKGYTRAQMAFCLAHGEELSLLSIELEEKCERRRRREGK
jgi:hypothetical protein